MKRRPRSDRVTLPGPGRWAAAGVLTASGGLGLGAAARVPGLVALVAATPEPQALAVTAIEVTGGGLAVLGLLALRRFRYDRLAARPGPIVITSFQSDGTAEEAPTGDVLADFRETLTRMSLSSPEPVPHAPLSDGVLDDARTAFADSRNTVGAAVVMLVSLVRVRHAYRVSAQLRVDHPTGRCGIAVHVSRMPVDRGDVRTVWADDWPTVAMLAAHAVGTYVIPRSRLSRRPPWIAWHGREMPVALFHQSQRASEHLRCREYDPALEALDAALTHDPQNPYLRIELGQAQEQLGLFLDATATYADLVALLSWYDRRLWCRLRGVLRDDTTGPPPPWTSGNPYGRDALLIARYRLVCRLVAAEQLARQWQDPPRGAGNVLRAAEHDRLRERIRIWLRPYAALYLHDDGDPRAGIPMRDALALVEAEGPRRLRHLLQFVAKTEIDALCDDYRWSQGRRRPGLAVTQTGLALLRIRARLSTDHAAAELGRRPASWPETPSKLDFEIAWCLLFKPRRARTWTEYYLAACVVTAALRGRPDDGTETAARDRRTLTLQAVRHLERAVTSTDSGDVGRYAQWLSTGDPDLNPLRPAPEFHDFLDRYLPHPGARVVGAEDRFLPLVMSHHALRLLASFCRRRSAFWSDATSSRTAQAEEAAHEDAALAAVAAYAGDHRHWPVRAALIATDRLFASRHGLPPMPTALPRIQDDPALVAVTGRHGATGDRRVIMTVLELRDRAWAGIARRTAGAEHHRRALRRDARDPAYRRAAAAFWDELADHVERCVRAVPTSGPSARGPLSPFAPPCSPAGRPEPHGPVRPGAQ